jgi:hypothetical protein
MNTNDKPAASGPDARLRAIIGPILEGLADQELNIRLEEEKVVTTGSLNGRCATFRVEGLSSDNNSEPGTLFLSFSYLRENDLQAAIDPDLSIGNRYHPARLAKRIGKPVPQIFDRVALALQQDYFRVVTDEDRLPAEVTDCRLLFSRGGWHPQVENLTQGLVADLKWVPAV